MDCLLIHALIEVGGFTIYPINPKQATRFREALHPTGRKNDPIDAELLAKFLQHHHASLRSLQPDTPLTRRLAELVQLRRQLVEERKRITLQLRNSLQNYFPLILELFENLESDLVTSLLQRWPSLLVLKRVSPSLLKTFLKEHGVRSEERREELFTLIRGAVDLTRDKALIEPRTMQVQCLARLIETLVRSIHEYDTTIAQVVAEHEDAAIFESLRCLSFITGRSRPRPSADRRLRLRPPALPVRSGTAKPIWHRPHHQTERKVSIGPVPPRLSQVPPANRPRIRRPLPTLVPLIKQRRPKPSTKPNAPLAPAATPPSAPAPSNGSASSSACGKTVNPTTIKPTPKPSPKPKAPSPNSSPKTPPQKTPHQRLLPKDSSPNPEIAKHVT